MPKIDYLIVGQGIAGTILAYQLISKNKSVLLVDKGLSNSSSIVAAGIINPLVLKRLTFSWRADEFNKYNESFYPNLNGFLKKAFHHKIGLLKVIKSEDDLKYWNKKSNDENLKNHISPPFSSKEHSKNIHESYLGGVSHCSWLDLKAFLKGFRDYLKSKGLLVEEEFDYEQLELRQYKNWQFDSVVFCEGRNAAQNPFFDFIGFSLTKGELLTIESKELKSDLILKKGVFVLPIGNNKYKVGATYEWQWKSEDPTESKKEKIIEQLNEIINCEYKIINHESGVRPSVIDRRPILGSSPLIPHYYLFNGLGSRGCLMAPLLAKELIDYMENGKELSNEVSLMRFLSKQG